MQIYGKFQLIPSYKRIVWVGSVMTPVLRVPAWDVFFFGLIFTQHILVQIAGAFKHIIYFCSPQMFGKMNPPF